MLVVKSKDLTSMNGDWRGHGGGRDSETRDGQFQRRLRRRRMAQLEGGLHSFRGRKRHGGP